MCVKRDTNTLTEILTVKAISVRYNTKYTVIRDCIGI